MDYAKMSDEELMATYKSSQAVPQEVEQPGLLEKGINEVSKAYDYLTTPDYTSMSNDELMQLYADESAPSFNEQLSKNINTIFNPQEQVEIIPKKSVEEARQTNYRELLLREQSDAEREALVEDLRKMPPSKWKELGLSLNDIIDGGILEISPLMDMATVGQTKSLLAEELNTKYGLTYEEGTKDPKKMAAEESLNIKLEMLGLAIPAIKGIGLTADTVLDKVGNAIRWPKKVREKFASWDMETYKQQQYMFNFMEKNGIVPTEVMLNGTKNIDNAFQEFSGSKNLFAVEALRNAQMKLKVGMVNFTHDTLKALTNRDINVNSISSWQDMKVSEDIIKQNITKLREGYRAAENDAFGAVEKIAKDIPDQYRVAEFSDNLIKQLALDKAPDAAINAVKNVLSVYSKTFKADTKELATLNSQIGKTNAQIAQLRKKVKTTEGRAQLNAETQLEKTTRKRDDLVTQRDELKDVKYMTTSDLMATVKRLNSRIYKSGGAISLNDADEIYALKQAKNAIEDFIGENVTNPEFANARKYANEITKTRVGLFGSKDDGGDKAMLARILNSGEYGLITEFMTNKNARENLLALRDTVGKDSELYNESLHLYLTNKLGISPEKINEIKASGRAVEIKDEVDLQKVAKNFQDLNDFDFKMIKETLGEEAVNKLKTIKLLSTNFGNLEQAIGALDKGIDPGKLAYVTKGGAIGATPLRAGKLILDAGKFYLANNMTRIIGNQPAMRTVTGALTGETVYLGTTETEDLTLEGAITSAILGGAGGYYGGKLTRSLIESDVAKIARYLKEGRGKPGTVPKDINAALTSLEEKAFGKTPQTMREELMTSETVSKINRDLPPTNGFGGDMPGKTQDQSSKAQYTGPDGEPLFGDPGGGIVPKLAEQFTAIPNVKAKIRRLENIFPKGSYIKPEEFSSYKPGISKETEAYLYARQGLGYLNDDPQGLPKVAVDMLIDSKKVRTGELSVEQFNAKGYPRKLDDNYGPQELLDEMSEYYSEVKGNKAHNIASVVIDKPLFVTKTNFDTQTGKVSAFAVSPENIKAFIEATEGDKVYKLPAGTNVTFVDRGGYIHEGSKGINEEVVLDDTILRNAKESKEILLARAEIEKLKKRLHCS